MAREAAMPHAMLLMVGVVVVVVGVGPSLGAPPLPYSLTQQEMMRSIIINQMAILKVVNESSSSCSSSHGDELNQQRQDMEKEWQAMNETMLEGMNNMNHTLLTVLSETMEDTRETRTREINDLNNKMDRLDDNVQSRIRELEEELTNKQDVINEINKKLEAVHNIVTDHHETGPDYLYVPHNDTYISLCDGHKVLYGSVGGLEVTPSGNYSPNLNCSWLVTLPERTRPVFRFHYIDIKHCNDCDCDYVTIGDPEPSVTYCFFGDRVPPHSPSVRSNKFLVRFHSDASGTGRGFKIRYRAKLSDY